MSRALTPAITLDVLKREARQWLKALRGGDAAAVARLRRAFPTAPADAGLRHVQQAIAREFGLASWAHVKAAVPATAAARDSAAVPVAADALTPLKAILLAADRGDAVSLVDRLDAHPELVSARGTLPGHTGMRTALHFGVAHEPIVRLLLARGADPNVRDDGDHAYPLHFAAERQDLPVIALLLAHGADPIGAGDGHELEVIGWATCWDYVTVKPEVLAHLLAHGARHHLFSAVAVGDVETIRTTAAADPSSLTRAMDRTNRHRTAVHLAVVKHQPASLRALLEIGAPIDGRDAAGLTPLDQAALMGDEASARLLIAHGAAMTLPAAIALGRVADVDRLAALEPGSLAPGGRWGSLIVRAAERSPGAVIEALVRRGASPDAIDDLHTAVDGVGRYTALHAAAWHGNTSAADALLRLGANPRVRDTRYFGTPLGWADFAGHAATRDRILGADVDIFDLITGDARDRVASLLAADPDALGRPIAAYGGDPAESDVTPLAWALERGRPEIAALLRDRGANSPGA